MLNLLPFYISALIVGQAEYFSLFDGEAALADFGSILPLLAGVHVFVVDIRLFSVLKYSDFALKDAYLVYRLTR